MTKEQPCAQVRALDHPLLLTAKQLAALLSLSVRSVWRLDEKGELPARLLIGGAVRWDDEEVRRWIRAGCPNRKRWEEMKVVSAVRKGGAV